MTLTYCKLAMLLVQAYMTIYMTITLFKLHLLTGLKNFMLLFGHFDWFTAQFIFQLDWFMSWLVIFYFLEMELRVKMTSITV